jgi:hypothetical protein
MLKEKVLPFKLTYKQYHWLRDAAYRRHISMGALLRNIIDTASDVERRRD